MNDNTVEIVSLIYSDADNRGFSTACSEVRHDRNRGDDHGRLGYYLNGYYLEDSATRDDFLFYLRNVPISRSISIDSRLLNYPEVLEVLRNSPDLQEVRFLDEDYVLTNEVLSLFSDNISIICDEVSPEVSSIDRSRVYTQHGLFKKETNYIEDDLVSGYFITKELSDEEISRLVEIVNNDNSSDYCQISFRVYNPALYRDLITKLRDNGLREDVRINLLGNPLYDRSEAYVGLDEISNNQISITYDTCSDMVQFYEEEPYSVSNMHHSELEGGGTSGFDSYFNMLGILEEQQRHIEEHNYSPLEAAIYAYRFLQQNYAYDPNSDITDAVNVLTNRQLDIVAGSPTMVCEGYGTLYSALMRRCGIPMFRYGTERHVRNIGRIVDDKYGIDHIGVFDPTWDGSHIGPDNSFDENNRFEFFMFSPRESVFYDPYITIPSSLVIDYESMGNPYLSFFSKDLYEADLSLRYSADGYAVTMLDRMGIQIPEPYSFDSYRGLIANLNNTSLFDNIAPDVFVSAYEHVLRTENPEFTSYDTGLYVLDALNSMRDRVNSYNGQLPYITINYSLDTPLATEDCHDEVAHLYPSGNTLNITDFNKPVESVSGNDEVVETVTIESPQVLYGPRPVDDEVETEEITIENPQVLYGPRPADDVISSDEVNDAIDDAMNSVDIENDEFIPGTRIRKPRFRNPYETDEEYVQYLAEYYGRYFPQAQQETRENTTYSLTKEQIIQDLPIYSNAPSRFNGVMTSEEIDEARRNIR